MSHRRKPDIVFTKPVKHHETPRQRLYNSRRRKNVKRSFGLAAMILGILALLMFIFPMGTFPLGILGLILAIVSMGVKTDGRDVGHHFATVGLWSSAASLVLTCVFWFVGEQNRSVAEKDRETRQTELVESLAGVWKSKSDVNLSMEFTSGGNLIIAKLASEGEFAERLSEVAGLYQVSETNIVIAFGPRSTKFTWELSPGNELYLFAKSDRDIALPIAGKWRKVKTLGLAGDYETATPQMKKYFNQLDEYTERKKELIKTLIRYTQEKETIVSSLKEYRDKKKTRDDRWRVLGRDLKSVNGYIELVNERVQSIDSVIVRLQGVIRNEGRQQDIARLGMSEEEMIDLLSMSRELEDKLKLEPSSELLDDDEVEKMLQDEKLGAQVPKLGN